MKHTRSLKTTLAILVLLTLIISLLTGCDSSQSTPAQTSKKAVETTAKVEESSAEKEPVTLEFALWNKDQEPVMREIADVFEKNNPNIKVNIQLTPYKQYWTKMETAATGGSLPDVLWMNGPRFITYAKNGMILPLSDKISASDIDLTKYPKGLLDLYTYDGQIYGIAKDWDTAALWYNKKLFDDANLAYPNDEWMWQDFMTAAKALTDKEKGIYGSAARIDDNQVGLYNTIIASGGYVISDDRKSSGYGLAETQKGVAVWKELLDSGSSPSVEILTDTPATDMFTSGKIAMLYGASWNVKPFLDNENIKGQLDIAMLPTIKEKGAVIHGLINAISANTKYPEEAWKLVEFLASKEVSDIWAKSGVVIPSHADSLELWLESYPDVNLKAYVDMLPYCKMYPCAESTMWADAEADITKLIWNDQQSVEDGCKAIEQKMNAMLK